MRYIKKQFPTEFFTFKKELINQLGKKEIHEFMRTTAILDVAFTDDFKEVLDTPAMIYKVKNKNSKNKELITLDKSYGAVKLKQCKIYTKLYTDGFILNGIKYVLFKRSTSKSRLGQTLFIDERILDDILLWSRMDLSFKENEPCDIAGLMAYESLTFSGIIGTIHITPEEILLIDDFKTHFISRASVTEYNEELKRLTVHEQDEPQEVEIFDGESLLDVSKFKDEFKDKGCLLLRNKFFKSCAFNCNIQKWFLDNNITSISQLNGITTARNINDIKLITTPNSLKAMKFSYKLKELPEYSDLDEQQLKGSIFDYWLKHIDFDYGICKYEKPSQFGERNQLSYQMLNSLPLSYDDVMELVGFRNPHVASGNVCVFTNRHIAEIDTYMNLTENIVVINAFENDVFARLQGADVDSDSCLLVQNNIILKAGKECLKFATPLNGIKGDKQDRTYNKADIAEVDYIIGKNMIGQIINLSQLFNSYYWDYKAKGATDEQLQTIYNCVSKLSSMSQMEIDKAKKFFTLNVKSELKKIINTVFNQSELDVLKKERSVMSSTKNRIKNKMETDIEAQAEYVEVCNILENNKLQIEKFIEDNRIIKLDTVELQKVLLSDGESAKVQEYDDDFSKGIIDKETYAVLINDLLVYQKTKQLKPCFFQHNSKDKNCHFEKFHTPMDFLTDIVNSKILKAKPDKTPMNLVSLLKDSNTKFADRKQANNIQSVAHTISNELKFCYLASKELSGNGKAFDYKAYKENKENVLSDGIKTMSKVKISKLETVLLLLNRCYSNKARIKDDSLSECRATLIALLYKAHTEMFLECFHKSE